MQSPSGPLEEIRRVNEGAALRLSFAGGAVAELGAAALWRECRSAAGVLRRLDNAPAPEGVTIIALQPVGDYAVNLAFSDGEARGIYPFSLLGQLAGRALSGARAAA